MAMRRIFWGSCRNCFLIDPLHYLLSCSAFGFEFTEIFKIKKRLPDTASRGVGDSLTRRVRESATLRLGESGNRWLSDSGNLGVDNSPTCRVWESAFEYWKENSANQRVGDSPTRRHPDLVSRGVVMVSRGVAISNFLKFSIDFKPIL
jgi:hypothetical protein